MFQTLPNRFYFSLWLGLINFKCNLEIKFQVAELFHNLKKRVSAFNMHVKAQPSPMDEEYVCKQRFILQVMLYCHKEMLLTKIAVECSYQFS